MNKISMFDIFYMLLCFAKTLSCDTYSFAKQHTLFLFNQFCSNLRRKPKVDAILVFNLCHIEK